ncbi:hypothetical protein quinque_009239 [Culex quinquefasciatus]
MLGVKLRVLIALSLSKVHEKQLHKSVDKHGALLYKIPPFCRRGSRSCRRPFSTRRFVEKHRAQIVSSAFKFMNETNPTVETHVWNSIVLVQKQITDWSGHLNSKFAFLFEDELHTLVYKICRLYFDRITLTRDQAYVLNLENLVR